MSRQPLNRRTFLRGAGTMIALPFLEAMLAPLTSHAAGLVPKRFATFYIPNGVYKGENSNADPYGVWRTAWPQGFHDDVMAAIKSQVITFNGVDNSVSEKGDGHLRSIFGFATGHPLIKEDLTRKLDSIDQIVARSLRGTSRIASLSVTYPEAYLNGNAGGANRYNRHFSYSQDLPVPMIMSARQLFDTLFPNTTAPSQSLAASSEPTMVDKKLKLRRSLIDAAKDDVSSLQKQLGSADRAILDRHLTSLREVEIQLQAMETPAPAPGGGTCSNTTRPADVLTLDKYVQVVVDLLVKAFECDITRVATFVMGNESGTPEYGFLGVKGTHHDLSHGAGVTETERADYLKRINKWQLSVWASFVQKLASLPDGSGSILSNSALMYGAGMTLGANHERWGIPVLLAGQAGGAVQTGRHINFYPKITPLPNTAMPLANVQLAVMQKLGVNVASFGRDGTNPVSL